MDNNSKRIAKNTIYLYIRMILSTIIVFFTSRVVLDKLGIDNYGLYNVVSSLAVTFVMFSSTLSNASQRFITVELGRNDLKACNNVFNQHLIVYALIALIVIILAEIVGVWYIDNKLIVSEGRLNAAHYTFQLAILTLSFNLLVIVFEALIVAHEDMKVYSYISVVESVVKLVIVYLLAVLPFDKLITYASLMAFSTIACKSYYICYSFSKYVECRIHWYWKPTLIKRTFSFVGWNMFGAVESSVVSQGTELLVNAFFGTVINAARGITTQVSGAIFRMSTNILTAAQPQMVKSYSREDTAYLEKLFFTGTRFSYLALFVMVCPVWFCIDGILHIWLVEVPDWTVIFIRLSLINGLIYILSRPIWAIILASGDIRNYMIISSLISMASFPMSFFLLKFGMPPSTVYVCDICFNAVNVVAQLAILKKHFDYSVKGYFTKVLTPIFVTTLASVFIAMVYSYMVMPLLDCNLIMLTLLSVFVIFMGVLVPCFYFGTEKDEREMIQSKFISLIPNKQ